MPQRWRIFNASSYEKLPVAEEDLEERVASDEALATIPRFQRSNKGPRACEWWAILTLINLIIFGASLLLLFAPLRRDDVLNAGLRPASAYSPVLESREIPLIDQKVSGKLFPADDGSDRLGRAEPGPETDERWQDFEWQRMFAVSSSEVIRLGKDPAKTIKFPFDYGLGDDAYMASLDVFHQIHCLNMLRKEAFKDYYFDGKDYREERYGKHSTHERVHKEFYYIHLRHCTDILLQALTCNPNTNMITMTWMEEQEMPWPDFSINKKCMDFEVLKSWRDDNAQPVEKLSKLKKPFDQTPIDKRYWELFGNDTHPGDNVHHPVWDIPAGSRHMKH